MNMKNIGIIGGLGPLATVDLFNKIVSFTDADKDQDHIPILIYNNPGIPDRTKAIFYGGKSPVEDIVKTGKILIDAGADFLTIPCNTAMYYYDEIQKNLSKEVLNIADITIKYIKENKINNVCFLGTEASIKARIYNNKLDEAGIKTYEVNDQMINMLTKVIYDIVKASKLGEPIDDFIRELDRIIKEENIEYFILGCTELPILFDFYKLNYKTINPTDLLAKKAVEKAGAKVRK